MSGNVVIVGGGISGLVAALLAARRNARNVFLVERESTVGGLLRSFDYGAFGHFDYGMHNMFETGVTELDAMLFDLLPRNEWQLLEGNRRDLAGLFYQGRLQRNSPYPDLRMLTGERREACVSDFFAQINAGIAIDQSSAYTYARTRFGQWIADNVLGPSVEKQFGRPAEEMDVMATMLTTMNRVVIFDEPAICNLMKSDLLRERIAYPEQRNLPLAWASGKKAYYPKRYGMYRLVEALCQELAKMGVSILTSTQVKKLNTSNARVDSMVLDCAGIERELDHVHQLFWTAGLPSLAPLMGVNLKALPFDKPLKTVVVNILLNKPLNVDDLYYFYCYDHGHMTFRVTNFSGYCEGAKRAGGYPVAVELLVSQERPDFSELEKYAKDELDAFGVLQPDTEMLFVRAEPLAAGFPMPSLKNMSSLSVIRESIRSANLTNLAMLGILSEERLFFQRDVLVHTFATVTGGEYSN